MKKLQNNFTTLEQSKRLLELGVPVWTADCLYTSEANNTPYVLLRAIVDFDSKKGPLPCWSVGRLMEIYKIVGEEAGQCISCSKGQTQVESLVQLYEENIGLLDFSKLNDYETTE